MLTVVVIYCVNEIMMESTQGNTLGIMEWVFGHRLSSAVSISVWSVIFRNPEPATIIGMIVRDSRIPQCVEGRTAIFFGQRESGILNSDPKLEVLRNRLQFIEVSDIGR
jgi:hypothetical protein